MQLFAGLMFNRTRIGLQAIYVAFEEIVLLAQGAELFIQSDCVLTLLLISGQAILAEDHVVSQGNSKHCGGACSDPATPCVDLFAYTDETCGHSAVSVSFDYLSHQG